jgi:hypothetical protein
MWLICRPAGCFLLVRFEGGRRGAVKVLRRRVRRRPVRRLTSSRYRSSFDGGSCAAAALAACSEPICVHRFSRPCRDHSSFTNTGPSGPNFRTPYLVEVNNDRDALALGIRILLALRRVPEHALALRFARRDTPATMKLEHRRGRGTIHHGDLGLPLIASIVPPDALRIQRPSWPSL